MLVVSDTSPLNYLVLVGAIDFLPVMFEEIVTSPTVLQELAHRRSPEMVRNWANDPPNWRRVRSRLVIHSILGLHRGETEAIALAEELHANAILVDERAATEAAMQRGITVVRTISVLAKIVALGMLDLQQTIERLEQTNFRGPIRAIEQLVAQFRDRES